ncbi:hypothetical protein CHARACLAT_016281 [Characodon lateralis]|uniref:Uncharacterized protein n=1 Tax=Characodon lateralis TaxID=208331 RepID=A0ABU7DRT6_9TELE|nr:hypothetical protein [Characodon lateralis]
MKDGKLHYIYKSRRDLKEHLAKVVGTAEEASNLFELHASDLEDTSGGEKPPLPSTTLLLAWRKRANIKEREEYNPIEVKQPLELAGMDLVGKLTVTNGSNQYVCVMVHYFTKWAKAYPLKTKTAAEVTGCIIAFINLVQKAANRPGFGVCEQGTVVTFFPKGRYSNDNYSQRQWL